MARFSDLSIEILQEIILWAFLSDQTNRISAYLPDNDRAGFPKDTWEDAILSTFALEEVRGLAIGIESFSLSQLLNRCFLRPPLSFTNTQGGKQSRKWQYALRAGTQTPIQSTKPPRALHDI
jgi:hypothetical protein